MKRDGPKRKSAAKAVALITDEVGKMEKAEGKAKRDEKKKIAATQNNQEGIDSRRRISS